jgi:hypothetical protein
MKKVIKVKLEPYSIESAIKEIQAYKVDLERRVRFLLKRLTDEGVAIAKAKVVEHKIIHDTELTNSINGFVSGNVGFIRVDDEHAVFFEFGTGPKGANEPHPLGGSYKGEGWYTRADGKPMDELYGWKAYPGEDGVYFFTEGQAAKPFMYETALKIRDMFPKIVKEVFG